MILRDTIPVTKGRACHLNKKARVADQIVFPFKSRMNFNFGYAWTMELAHKLGTPVALFTLITDDYSEEEKKLANHALFQAHGKYLHDYEIIHRRAPKIRSRRIILPAGMFSTDPHFADKLSQFILREKPYLAVLQPSMFSFDDQKRIASAGSTIVLPEITHSENPEFSRITPQQFYDVFRRSQLLHVDSALFERIGSDKALFNYLVSVFKGGRQH